jgi:RyR domain
MSDSIKIANVCHEANRAYCQTIGDNSQPSWEDAPDWQRESAIKGVEFNIANPSASASASHDSWLEVKRNEGWKYGPVKDPEKKEHPCFVHHEELPIEQQKKDHLFKAIVAALI